MKRNPVAWAALLVSTAALVSSSGVLRRMPAAPNVPAESQKTVRALSQAFESVAEFVRPSVVQISVQKKAGRIPNLRGFPFPGPGGRNPNPGIPNNPRDLKDFEEMLKRFFGPDGDPEHQQFGGRGTGTGSGFVYDSRGHIVTNNHVVDGAEKITVAFHDGTEATATVVGTDSKADIAVIKVDNYELSAASQGRQLQAQGRRAGHGRRVSVRAQPERDHGNHLGDGTEQRRDQRIRVVPANRRPDQSRQFGRTACEHER